MTSCVHHPGVPATHRMGRSHTPLCGPCAARITARLDRQHAAALPQPIDPPALFDPGDAA